MTVTQEVHGEEQSGIVLISTMFMIIALLGMLGAYFMLTRVEIATTRSTKNSSDGFFAAEGGLNLRAQALRQRFVDYNIPDGESPHETGPCEGGNNGSGDFACDSYDFGGHEAVTYVTYNGSVETTVPPGELYQNLSAEERRYTVRSLAYGPDERVEAILELHLISRLVPLFQFVAFYDKDLEVAPGANMTLSGPAHSNGDIYIDAVGSTLEVRGQVTSSGNIFRGKKRDNSCGGTVRIATNENSPPSTQTMLQGCGGRIQLQDSNLPPFNGYVQHEVEQLVVPSPDLLIGEQGALYWDKADLRLVLHLNGSNNAVRQGTGGVSLTGVEVRNVDGSVNVGKTNQLDSCGGTLWDGRVASYQTSSSDQFYDQREDTRIDMLDVDVRGLLNCIHQSMSSGSPLLDNAMGLADDTDDGLVIHLSVDGPDTADINSYGVRVQNGWRLQASIGGAPTVQGITWATDQAFYVWGDYNSSNKIPSAFLADTFNALSNNWSWTRDRNSTSWNGKGSASTTTVNAAILSGTDSTGGVEGTAGQGGSYNGGLENYPRFHENWSGNTWYYLGSFVSLGTPNTKDGPWQYGNPNYTAPQRIWDYDTDFNNSDNLPPLTPRFVYLRQELFVRDFEQSE